MLSVAKHPGKIPPHHHQRDPPSRRRRTVTPHHPPRKSSISNTYKNKGRVTTRADAPWLANNLDKRGVGARSNVPSSHHGHTTARNPMKTAAPAWPRAPRP